MLESCCSRRGILETKDANIRSAPFSFDRLLKFLYPCSCDGFSIITADSISLSFFFAYSFYKKSKTKLKRINWNAYYFYGLLSMGDQASSCFLVCAGD